MLRKASLSLILAGCLGFLAAAANSQEDDKPWTFRGDFQGLVSAYSGSLERDALRILGAFVRADYLDEGSVTFGFNSTKLDIISGSGNIDQNDFFLSGQRHLTPDWASGRITLRLDGHFSSNDDVTNETDDVTVIAPQVSFLNYEQTFYFDLGYSMSKYGDSLLTSERVEVDQLTPTVGLGFNEQGDWLQLRAYLIDPSGASRAGVEGNTAALEVKWTHWTTPRRPLGFDNIRVSAVFGERLLIVDPDAGSTHNLSDLQTGGASLGGEWGLSERNRLLLMLGVQRYENRELSDEYDNAFVYLNFTHLWN